MGAETLRLRHTGVAICREGHSHECDRPGRNRHANHRAWVDDPEKRADMERHIPLMRAGTARELAAVTAFLASDEADYITGQTIFVDGGLTLYADFLTPWSSE